MDRDKKPGRKAGFFCWAEMISRHVFPLINEPIPDKYKVIADAALYVGGRRLDK